LDEGPNVSPPNEWGVIENVFDENNSQMLSTGLKSPEELVALINQKNEFFAVDFGIDFADGTPIPGFPGAVTAGNFAMYPYGTAGAAIQLDLDSDNVGRGATGTWSAFQLGWACPALSDGVFQGGKYVGEPYKYGDVISFFLWVFAPTNGAPLTKDYIKFADVIQLQSPWLSKNVLDQNGFEDTLSRLQCFDDQGAEGYYFEDYEWQLDPETGDVKWRFRAIFTWPNPGQPVQQKKVTNSTGSFPNIRNPRSLRRRLLGAK